MREDGFKELNDKYGSKYDFWESAAKENEHKYDYFINGAAKFGGYFDSKENGVYYNQSVAARTYITLRKVGSFYYDIFMLWGLLGFSFLFFNANLKVKNTNTE